VQWQSSGRLPTLPTHTGLRDLIVNCADSYALGGDVLVRVLVGERERGREGEREGWRGEKRERERERGRERGIEGREERESTYVSVVVNRTSFLLGKRCCRSSASPIVRSTRRYRPASICLCCDTLCGFVVVVVVVVVVVGVVVRDVIR
jgi:hypothetical protein